MGLSQSKYYQTGLCTKCGETKWISKGSLLCWDCIGETNTINMYYYIDRCEKCKIRKWIGKTTRLCWNCQ